MNGFFAAWAPRVLSVLRIIAGFLMLWHGSQKLFAFPPPQQPGELNALMLVAGVIEFFGGVLILIGLFTRPAAFLISGLMAVAYFMAHASGGLLPLVNKGELAVVYSFLYLYFVFSGPGPWSVDSLIWKKGEA
ncbi:MAG TPA: DoxX family protein [Pyrinomonadaceae bacterium]|nr:DoxX family protein [Pyrinomonadaceae bacterium]